jgi:hypothetical protein
VGLGSNRIALGQQKIAGNTIKFEVQGKVATPSNRPKGDTTLVATDPATPLIPFHGFTQVIVIVPSGIAKKHDPGADGRRKVTPENILGDRTTNPAFPDVPKGKVVLVTIYVHRIEIPVVDQFGKPLNAIYATVPITERNNIPINAKMHADGTYADATGVVYPAPNIGFIDPTMGAGLVLAAAWPKEAPIPLKTIAPKDVIPQRIKVQVGGHPLTPSIFNRKIIPTAPDIIDILWPDYK